MGLGFRFRAREATLFPAEQETIVAMCGPPVMLEKAARSRTKKRVFKGFGLRVEGFNPKPETRNPKPETLNPKP